MLLAAIRSRTDRILATEPPESPMAKSAQYLRNHWDALTRFVTRQCRMELRDQLRDSYIRSCIWTTPGTVWAADVWMPDAPIDGQFRYVLDVRDLASGCLVASEPLERNTADAVGAVFDRLYRRFGAPLVCKTDNGSEL